MSKVLDLSGKETGKIELPIQFSEEFRPDLIKRAVLAMQTHSMQPHGTKVSAGNRHVGYISKRRHRYKTGYGYNQSRTQAKVMSRSGTRFNRKGANVPQAVGGRIAHPPKVEKVLVEKINTKERRKAIRSALYATTIKALVEKRGHQVKQLEELPIIIINDIEKIAKTSEVEKLLKTLGLSKEIERTKEKKVRPGKGKSRGRKYKRKTGPLFVVSKRCDLLKSAKNIAGVETTLVKDINSELLAPGSDAGRLVIWSEEAIKQLGDKKLFM